MRWVEFNSDRNLLDAPLDILNFLQTANYVYLPGQRPTKTAEQYNGPPIRIGVGHSYIN